MDGKPSLGKAQKIGTCSTQQPDFQVSINPHCKSIWKKGNPGTSSHRSGWSAARSHTLWLSNVLSDELPHLRPNSTLFFTWAFLLNPNPNHHIFFFCVKWVLEASGSSTEFTKCCWHTWALQKCSLTFWRDLSLLVLSKFTERTQVGQNHTFLA